MTYEEQVIGKQERRVNAVLLFLATMALMGLATLVTNASLE